MTRMRKTVPTEVMGTTTGSMPHVMSLVHSFLYVVVLSRRKLTVPFN
jgi:hypothetical protein